MKKIISKLKSKSLFVYGTGKAAVSFHELAKSNDFEKTDPLNGFMLTPTFDFMFDRGFLSFTDDKKSILSPFLSNMTYSKLGIADGKTFSHLPIEGRENYLEFHRTEILKR